MISGANEIFPEPVASENVGDASRQHREELEWRANFLIGDEMIAEDCVVDAGTLAEPENPDFQEWLSEWACMATIRAAIQIHQRRIAQLASTYKRRPCIHGGHTALSSDLREILVEESNGLIARLDVLCRFALVICGLEKRSAHEAALLLGVDATSVEGAYCAAIKFLEAIGCEQFQWQNDSAAVCN